MVTPSTLNSTPTDGTATVFDFGLGEEEGEETADLPGFTPSPADEKLATVFGDHLHDNSGFHLSGGIEDNQVWLGHWRRIAELPSQQYDLPKGQVGRTFLTEVSNILEGVMKRKWNAERLIVFAAVILQRQKGVSSSKKIRARILNRLQMWADGHYGALVEDTVSTNGRQRPTDATKTEDQIRHTYCSLLLRGKVREAVRFLTSRSKGGVLLPESVDPKTGLTVVEVLRKKHPSPGAVDVATMEDYPSTPPLFPLLSQQIT